jgi:hypothetical protein
MGLTITVVEQLNGIALYELKSEDNDDTDDEIKIEKEKEKETYTFRCNILPINNVVDLSNCTNPMFIKDDKLLSELFNSLPKLPPELECGFQPA